MRFTLKNIKLQRGQIALWYFGQESFLICADGVTVLVDPYLSETVDRANGYAPDWCRKYPAPVTAEELGFVDYVFCTHGHIDHADPDTLSRLADVCDHAKFIVPRAIRGLVESFGVSEICDADADVPLVFPQFTVMPIPAAHEEIHRDGNGNVEEMGYVFDFDGVRLYHGGDTCVYNGLAERIRDVHVMMVPVNGRDYFRYADNIIGNMDSREALMLANTVNADLLVPMHYDLYPANGLNPAVFVDWQQKINPMQKIHLFAPGECLIYQP